MSLLEIDSPVLARICDKIGMRNGRLRSFVGFCECFSDRVAEHHIFLVASGIAFNIILYIIPLLLVIIFAISYFFSVNDITSFLSNFLHEILPPGQQTENLLSSIIKETLKIFSGSGIAGIIGICSLVWISSLLLGAIRAGLNMIYDLPDKKVFIIYKIKDIFLTLLLAVMVLLTIYILPVVEIIQSALNYVTPDFIEKYFTGAIFLIVSLAMSFLMFFFIYQLVPNERIPKRKSLLAASVCVILVEVSRRIFAFYVAGFASYGKFYGTYAIIVSMCVWLYYLTLILLFCAEFSQLISEYLEQRKARKNLK